MTSAGLVLSIRELKAKKRELIAKAERMRDTANNDDVNISYNKILKERSRLFSGPFTDDQDERLSMYDKILNDMSPHIDSLFVPINQVWNEVNEIEDKLEKLYDRQILQSKLETNKEEAERIAGTFTNRIKSIPHPLHGTQADWDELRLILKKGLRSGSALDTTANKSWIEGYWIVLVVPGAKKGEYVSHNNYYKSKGVQKVSRVLINAGEVSTDIQKIKQEVSKLRREFPHIKFEVYLR